MSSSSNVNQAAWLTGPKARPFKVDSAPMPPPGPRQILIRVHAIAINPVDAAVQNLGLLYEKFPAIIGCDVAGEVVEVGPEVTGFKKGDRVIAALEDGAFQKYCLSHEVITAKLPAHVKYTEGAVLPICLATAAAGMFLPWDMGLDLPSLEATKDNGKVVLVWGGASSVGSCAVQLLKGSGYTVFTTASEKNAKYCTEEIRADRAFDYKDEEVEAKITNAVEESGKTFAGVFSAIIAADVIEQCARIAARLGKDEKSKVVGTVMPTNWPAIPQNIPEGVRLAYCNCTVDLLPESTLRAILGAGAYRPNDVAPLVFGSWVTAALESGAMRCKPNPQVVGSGLEALQEAVDLMSKGVSAKKLVVEIP